MNQMSRVIGLFAVAAALNACGGGGGGGDSGGSTATTGASGTGSGATGSGGTGPTPTPTPTPPPPPPPPSPTVHSANDIQNVAALGLNVQVWTGHMNVMPYLGAVIHGYGFLTPVSPQCTSGTATVDLVKAGAYQGLRAGDQLIITYDQCILPIDTHTIDGKAVLTARDVISTNSYWAYAVKFEAEVKGFSIKTSQGTEQYSGTLDVDAQVSTVDSDNSFVVPAGNTFTYSKTIASTPVTVVFDSGSSFSQSDHPFNSNSRKLDGSVNVTLGSTPAWPLLIATPVALSDKDLANFTAETGTANTTLTDENIATSTTVTGANAVISGDSDGNGSLDLVINTTWLALTGNN